MRLFERNTHSVSLAPNKAASQLQPVFGHNQYEFCGHPDEIRHLNRCSGCGDVANYAVDLVAAMVDLGGLGNTVARRNTGFDHDRDSRLKESEPITTALV
jgi:hypothetical protein